MVLYGRVGEETRGEERRREEGKLLAVSTPRQPRPVAAPKVMLKDSSVQFFFIYSAFYNESYL